MSTIVVNQNWLNQNKNEKERPSCLNRLVEYSGSTAGSIRYLSVLRNALKLSGAAQPIADAAGTAISTIGLVRWPAAMKDAYTAVSNLTSAQGPVEVRAGVAVRDVMEAVASCCKASAFIKANPVLQNVSQWADLAGDGADLGLSIDGYKRSSARENGTVGEVKEAYSHSRKYYMLRIAKAVLSFASAFFAALMIVTGMRILPVVLAILMSLAATLVAIRRDLYREEGKYKFIDVHNLAFA